MSRQTLTEKDRVFLQGTLGQISRRAKDIAKTFVGDNAMTQRKLLILVADDYDDSANLLASFLEMETHHEAVAAKDGLEAIELSQKRRPDVCVLDIDMPRINGIEAARWFRTAYNEGECPMLIAVSGASANTAKLSGLFDFVLAKPYDAEVLISRIETAQA